MTNQNPTPAAIPMVSEGRAIAFEDGRFEALSSTATEAKP